MEFFDVWSPVSLFSARYKWLNVGKGVKNTGSNRGSTT